MAIPIKAVLSVSTKGFNVALRGAGKVLGGFVALTKMATVAVLGLTAAFTAIVFRQAAVIDRLGKVSKVTGVAAETLQKFQFAAELAGVSSDQAAVALRRFSRRLGEAQKNTGELAPTLRRLGINVRDVNGRFKSAEEVLFELADGIAATEGESAKLSIAFKAFDSEGAELVNTLSQGGDALQEVFNRAEALGFILSTSAIQGVEDFNDSFKELTTLLGGITNQLVAALAPALEDITIRLTDFLLELGKRFGGVENLGEALALGLIESIKTIISAFANLERSVIGFINRLKDFGRSIGFTELAGDAAVYKEQVDLIKEAFKSASGSPLEQFLSRVQTLNIAFDTLRGAMDRGSEVGFGLDPEDLQKFIDNQTILVDRYKELEGLDLTDRQQYNRLSDIQKILNENLGLIYEAFDAQIFNSDQIEFQYEKYRLILAELERMQFLIMGNKTKQEEISDETEKELTFREKILAAIQRTKEILDDVMENVATRLGTPLERLQKTLEDGLVKGVELFETALTDAILTGKADFTALGDHIKRVLAQALVQRFITGPILAAFGLAKGGPAKAGNPYIVGEEGPELFIPNQSGTVVPNNQLSGRSGGMGGGTVINITAVDTQSFQQAIAKDPEFIFNVSRAGQRRTPA